MSFQPRFDIGLSNISTAGPNTVLFQSSQKVSRYGLFAKPPAIYRVANALFQDKLAQGDLGDDIERYLPVVGDLQHLFVIYAWLDEAGCGMND